MRKSMEERDSMDATPQAPPSASPAESPPSPSPSASPPPLSASPKRRPSVKVLVDEFNANTNDQEEALLKKSMSEWSGGRQISDGRGGSGGDGGGGGGGGGSEDADDAESLQRAYMEGVGEGVGAGAGKVATPLAVAVAIPDEKKVCV